MGAAALVQLVISGVLSHMLSKPDYATYRQTFLVYNMLVPFLTLGLPASLLYFIPKNETRQRGLLNECLIVICVMSIAFSAFLLGGGAKLLAWQFHNPDLYKPLLWFSLMPIFALPVLCVHPALVATDRVRWSAIFTVFSQFTRLVFVVGPVAFIAATPLIAIRGQVVASLVIGVVGLVLMMRAVASGSSAITIPGIRQQLYYSIPLGLGSFIGTINKGLDKVIVASLCGTTEFADFVNGAMEVPFIGIVTGSAAAVMVPDLTRMYEANQWQDAVGLFRRSALKSGQVLIPFSGWLFISAPWIMTTIYGPDFLGSANVFRIYLLLLPLRIVFFGPLFQAAGRSDLILIRTLITLVGNLVLTITLTRWLGPVGAAIGTVISVALFAYTYCLVTTARLYQAQVREMIPFKEILLLLLPVIIVCTVWLMVSPPINSANIFWAWIAVSIVYPCIILASYLWMKVISIQDIRNMSLVVLRRLGIEPQRHEQSK